MLSIVLCFICVCQATQETYNELQNSDSEYDKVGVYNFDDIEYLFFGFQVTFDEARVICLNYKAQLAVLNTKKKADFIARAMTSTFELEEFWIGAQLDNADSWHWIDKKQKLNLDYTFYGDLKIWDKSVFTSNNRNCLTVYRESHSTPTFVPLQCSKKRPFICQREIDRFGIRANEVDVIKVNDEEFTLYSARATWAEAVVQCRQKGLQIAEVKSKKVAQNVAMSMLRARPDAMENVWIGGYLKESSWEWLASSEEITVNELWPNDTKLLTGCLLLDRHVCEDPIYVSVQCDRKRHILCQKPPIKIISKKPSSINVDGCPYWVGFYPLEWLDARRSCQTINASLVILDSPTIIDHVMTLMVDYKQELRHIWTDGHRRKSDISLEKKNAHNTWYWSSTGEPVPMSGSFIPWCADQDTTKNTNCLNLDRENHKTPVVYGLSCRKNQTYICQPWKGDCVSHRVQEDLLKNPEFLNLYSSLVDIKPVKKPTIALSQNSSREVEEDVSHVYEDMSNMQKLHSTETYFTSSVSYSIPQQVTYLLEETTQHITDEKRQFYVEKEEKRIKQNEVNQTISQNLITDFFSPLIQFTLPSLPQFGIKVVSAEITTPKSEVKKVSVTSKSEGTTTKIVMSPTKINNRTQVTKNAVQDSKKNSSNLNQMKEGTNKKIPPNVINKYTGLVKTVPKAEMKSPVIENVNIMTISGTTEKMNSVSPGGLYGDDVDYYDSFLSKPENTGITEATEDYEELIKSLEASGKLAPLLNEGKENSSSDIAIPFAQIFQKRINDEIQSVLKSELQSELRNNSQQTLMEFSAKNAFKNTGITSERNYPIKSMDTKDEGIKNMEVTKNPNIQGPYIHDLIPPYYAFESPLKVELLDDGTVVPISPIVPESRRTFQEEDSGIIKGKTNATLETDKKNDNTLDFQLSKFNPHDKDSMLQLGRFLKNMFAGKNPNAQQIDFNLIARRDISETNEVAIGSENTSLSQKNNIQDTIPQNEDYSEITTIITTTVITTTPQSDDEKKTLRNCQKELDNLKKTISSKTSFDNLETKYLREPCKNVSVLISSPPFKMPRMFSESRKEYSFPNSNENVDSSMFNIFKSLVKGIRIDIKEANLKNYVNKFVQERLPNPEEFDFDSDLGKYWHRNFKKILHSLNGTAIRFHGERVQLRFGSFGYKKKSKSKLKFVKNINTTTSPEIYDSATTRNRINDNQDHYSSKIIDNPLKNTHKNEYLFSRVQSKNDDFSKQNQHKKNKNKSNIRRKWSHLNNTKKKLKKRKKVEGMESKPMFSKYLKNETFSPAENWKLRALNSEKDIERAKNSKNESLHFAHKLQIDRKFSKKSRTKTNEENPFSDFPVINFDMRRAEDSFENGFETVRIGRAAKRSKFSDESSIVSIYLVMKHQNNADGEQFSIPILELHVRMPADSFTSEENYDPDTKTGCMNDDQLQNTKVQSYLGNFRSQIIQEPQVTGGIKINPEAQMTRRKKMTQKTQRKLKSEKPREPNIQKHKKSKNKKKLKYLDMKNIKNYTDLNYEKANNFLSNIIKNFTNFKTVPDLKRKRQLLYLALKYLRRITNEKLRKQSGKDEENSRHRFINEIYEKRQVYRNPISNPNWRVQIPHSEVQNSWQPLPLYPGLDNRPLVLNPAENELDPKPGLFNPMHFFNYNTKRYDDMPFNIIKTFHNTRMRRNASVSENSRSRLFFSGNGKLDIN